jgi:hypothetical protein
MRLIKIEFSDGSLLHVVIPVSTWLTGITAATAAKRRS